MHPPHFIPFSGIPHQDRTKACRSTYKDTATRIRVREPPVPGGVVGGRTDRVARRRTAALLQRTLRVRARLQARGGADRRPGRHVGSRCVRDERARPPGRPSPGCSAVHWPLGLQNRGRCKPACPHLLHRINLADASCLGGWGERKDAFFSLSSVLRCAILTREQGRRSTADDLESEVPTNQTNRYALGGPREYFRHRAIDWCSR